MTPSSRKEGRARACGRRLYTRVGMGNDFSGILLPNRANSRRGRDAPRGRRCEHLTGRTAGATAGPTTGASAAPRPVLPQPPQPVVTTVPVRRGGTAHARSPHGHDDGPRRE
ncbi:hypothetical protein GCM10010273_45570 [Streptomyces lavendulocolor]